MPLINAIGLSENMSPVVLKVHDFLEHMSAGGNKDASHFAAMFLHSLTVIDKKKDLTDLIIF